MRIMITRAFTDEFIIVINEAKAVFSSYSFSGKVDL